MSGIGQRILAALMQTLNNERYRVWNSRTQDTLEILRRSPRKYTNIGAKYKEINRKLQELANELGQT